MTSLPSFDTIEKWLDKYSATDVIPMKQMVDRFLDDAENKRSTDYFFQEQERAGAAGSE